LGIEETIVSRRVFDVVVAGAGPGGLLAATEVAKQGLSVHVVDKKSVVGIPVKCGEYLPTSRAMAEILPNAGGLVKMFDVPDDAISNRCRTIRFYSPKGMSWEFEFEANIVDRTIMEQGFAEELEKLGGTIQLNTPCRLFTMGGHHLVGRDPETAVEGRVVIAADGFPSAIGTTAGLPFEQYDNPVNVAINYEYYMKNLQVDPSVTEMFMGNDFAPGGYGWIIPKGNGAANVGIGIRTPFSKATGNPKDGMEYLRYFIEDFPLVKEKVRNGRRSAIIADVLPVDGPIPRTYGDYVLAVGDAAGMVMPTNGGGIAPAMITGKLAGEVAARHLQEGAPLSMYETLWKRAMGKAMDDSTRLRRMSDWFMKRDYLFHLILRILSTKGIKDVITCRAPAGVGPLLRFFG
jgi:digeranylgeranylglycerophospholipid reductase